jgi:hypothetical protein
MVFLEINYAEVMKLDTAAITLKRDLPEKCYVTYRYDNV